jgi:hypothetical protein
MMWMLKIHVLLSILLLLVAIFFTENFPRLSILILFLSISGILGVDIWIFYNYKRCIGKSEMLNSDKRFLNWIVATMVVSASLWLGILIIFGVIINKYGKQQVTKQATSDAKDIKEKAIIAMTNLDLEITKMKEVYYSSINEMGYKNLETFDVENIFEKPTKSEVEAFILQRRINHKTIDYSRVVDKIRRVRTQYDEKLKKKGELQKSYKFWKDKCTISLFGSKENNEDCIRAKQKLNNAISSASSDTSSNTFNRTSYYRK